MKNWKSNLFVVVLVIFILVCGFMLGRMNFGTDVNSDNQNVNEDDNVSENNSVNDNKINSSEDFMSLFVGEYNYEKKYDELNCSDYMNLKINDDGTYTYNYGSSCATGYVAFGKFAISDSKIYLFNDNCKVVNVDGECLTPNCSSLIELDYVFSDNQVKIFDNIIGLGKN